MIYDLYFRATPRRHGRKGLLAAAAQLLQSVRAGRNAVLKRQGNATDRRVHA